MDVAKLRIVLELNGANVRTGFAGISASATAMERTTTGALNRVKSSFNGLTGTQKALAGFGITAIGVTTALRGIIKPAIEFESAFAGVEKTVDGTPQQLREIRDGLLDMSTVMPTAASDLAAIAENAGQLGVKAGDVLNFTRVVAQLGETTDLSFTGAAQSMARFLNITDGGVQNIQGAADVLVELGNNSATTESQILTFSTRLAAAFTAAGATQDQIQATAATFSSLGVEAEAGGTALSRVITEISDAAKLGGNELKVFANTAGLSVDEFRELALSQGGAVEAMRLFVGGLGDVIGAGRSITPILETLDLNSVRISRTLTLGALSAELYAEQLRRAATALAEGGAAQTEYDKRLATTESRLKVLGNQLQVVAIRAGTPFLEGVAGGADLAADAIRELVDILGPTAETLGDSAENAVALGRAIGTGLAPALKGVLATLIGATTILTEFLNILNAFGPAGLAVALLAADIALVGPASQIANAGLTRLGITLKGVTTGATGASTATTGLSASLTRLGGAARLLKTAGVIAVIFAVGQAVADAGAKGDEAAGKLGAALDELVDEGRYRDIATQLRTTGREIDKLRELDKVPEGLGLGFDAWKQSLISVGQILTPFTENTMINARAEAKALNEELARQQLGTFEDDARLAANALGLTEEQVVTLATELGLFDSLFRGTVATFHESIEIIDQYVNALDAGTVSNNEFFDKLIENTTEMSDFADQLGLTERQLGILASQVEGVDLEDLFDDDIDTRVAAFTALLNELGVNVDALAESLGITSGELLEQIGAVNDLAAAHDALGAAIDTARSAMELMQRQTENLATATANYEEAVANLDGSEASLRALGEATAELTLATAGSGISAEEAILKQVELYAEFVRLGEGAGFATDFVVDLAAELLSLPPSLIVDIAVKGEAAALQAEGVGRELSALERKVLIELGIIDEATVPIQGVQALLTQSTDPDWLYFLTANDVDAQEAIDRTTQKTEDLTEALWELNVQAETSAANTDIDSTRSNVEDLVGFPWSTEVTVETDDANTNVSRTRSNMFDFTASDWRTTVHVEDDDANTNISRTRSNMFDFTGTDWRTEVAVETEDANEDIDATRDNAFSFVTNQWLASLQVATSDANEDIDATERNAADWSRNYQADLTADDRASSKIRAANNELARFQSKNITLTTTYVSTGTNRYVYEDGGIFPAKRFADGGLTSTAPTSFEQTPIGQFKLERPKAGIFSATMPGRIFAHHTSGDEGFIPLGSNKRREGLRAFGLIGRRLGVFEDGGIMTTGGRVDRSPLSLSRGGNVVSVSSPIRIDITGTDGDLTSIGDEFERRLRSALDDVTEDLRNLTPF